MKRLLGVLILFVGFSLTSNHQISAQNVIDAIQGGIAISGGGCALVNTGIETIVTQCQSDEPSLETWIKSKNPKSKNLSPQLNYNQDTGAIGTLSSAMGTIIDNPAASTGYYVADLLQNTSLAPQAYAQGLGFSSLTPVLGIWKAFRNIAYFLFVIIFVVIGFAIMLRAQLNPQTVVSIQSALPKLVVTLLLITFSYAIAGLLIDLMYVAIFLMVALADQFIFKGSIIDKALDTAIFGNHLSLLGTARTGAEAVGTVLLGIFSDGGILAELAVGTLSWISTITVLVILVIAILISMFRTFFALLSAYISIILHVITAPLQIMLNALPGSNAFFNWLRNIFANLAVFPAIIGMIILANALAGIDTQDNIGYNNTSQGGFIPPQIPGRGVPNAIQGIIAIGVIMLMPEVAKVTKGALGVKESELGAAVRQNLIGNRAAKGVGYLGYEKFAGLFGTGPVGQRVRYFTDTVAYGEPRERDRVGRPSRRVRGRT